MNNIDLSKIKLEDFEARVTEEVRRRYPSFTDEQCFAYLANKDFLTNLINDGGAMIAFMITSMKIFNTLIKECDDETITLYLPQSTPMSIYHAMKDMQGVYEARVEQRDADLVVIRNEFKKRSKK